MTSYQIEIKQCPNCGCEFQIWAVASCNTIDAKFYTDGFVDGPMYDEGGDLLTCPECKRYFWWEDVPTKKTMRDFQSLRDPELGLLPHAGEVRGHQYEDILSQALWKTEAQEKYIRIRAWWSFNRVYRDYATEEFNMSHEGEANLLRLLQLLDPNDPDESIMKAEVLRQLGQFDECLKQLDQPVDDSYLKAIDTIKKLANCKKRYVVRIE